MPVTLDDIRAAARRIGGAVLHTACSRSQVLSRLTGAELFLKFENHQFTAAFKERGALNRLLALTEAERRRGVIAMSAGNHAQAVAYHAERLGIAATIVMPRHTPNVKVRNTRAFGADVRLEGETVAEAGDFAQRLAAERDLVFVHPYDDPAVIAGQGTTALEMLADVPDLDTLVVPVGGGGLIAGMAVAARSVNPAIEVIGVQTRRYPAVHQALAGLPVECGPATIADGIAVKRPGELTLPLIREWVREVVLVDEPDIERAVLQLLEIEKTVVEGAGAAGLAAVLADPERFRGRRVGLVLCGGNIDLLPLSSVIQRGLVRTKRVMRVRVGVPDVPGALADLTRLLADARANVIHIAHQRAFTDLSVRATEVEATVETLGEEHSQAVIRSLREAGYDCLLPDHEPHPREWRGR
ncbi:threonine ammonia-lyase [Sediminicurvatus halobius]|uniref:Threonine ammonia-lyase n=1 Tax=Sediminicurvatus halobius TaxID=2182432 RepID=A0A2U2MX17_9GAMM|nr:threonine ammonia-lyase [Spiribacter halobius]PWG61389.1 threonine ammonia-lyase [Spiribacter halobius]UEX78554.1 threonine ammonia-lyase [Spiribacter halobius]